MSGLEVAEAMDATEMVVQHAMSNTKWFFPSRTAPDDFYASYRRDYESVSAWFGALCPPADG